MFIGDYVGNMTEKNFHTVDKSTICQSTGLIDKNTKLIWENDIVKIPREDEYFVVEWQKDTASFVMNSDELTVNFDDFWACEVEVIGNVFDNSASF